MQAEIVSALLLKDDNGRVTHIAFSRHLADFILAIMYEYAQDDPDGGEKQRAEIDNAREIAQSANLPQEATPADGHYCAMSGVAQGLHLTEEQLTKAAPEASSTEDYQPGFALCCYIPGGRHGIRLAFSREAAKAIYDEPVPAPFGQPTEVQVKVAKETIEGMALPFPGKRVPLDDQFEKMLQTLAQTHR